MGVMNKSCEHKSYAKVVNKTKKLWTLVQGIHKKMCRSFCLIALATNMLEGWDTIHLKGEIHSSFWSTKTISKTIWGTRFKDFEIMNNLIYLNLILPRFMHNFSSYEYFRRPGHISILKVTSFYMLKVQTHFSKT